MIDFKTPAPTQPVTMWDLVSPYWKEMPEMFVNRDDWESLLLDPNGNSFREIGHRDYVSFQDGDSLVGGLYVNKAVGQTEFVRYRITFVAPDGSHHPAIVPNAKSFRSALYNLPRGSGYAFAVDIWPECFGPRIVEDSNARYDQMDTATPAQPIGHGSYRSVTRPPKERVG